MRSIKYYVGVDIAAETFTASVLGTPEDPLLTTEPIANSPDAFPQFVTWLKQHHVRPHNALVCLENTGVYGEVLCYFLQAQGFSVAVEMPHKVKRAFHELRKNDRVDARQIAEYACRYRDQLTLWHPQEEVLEQIRTLSATREHFTRQLIANRNALQALQRKAIPTPLATEAYQQMMQELKNRIKAIDQAIQDLINQHPTFKPLADLADSVPGVGQSLSGCLVVLTEGFSNNPDYRELASRLGLAPHEHTSGTSVRKKPRSKRHGHARTRKLLHLAARSVAQHREEFRLYYLRKIAEGKAPGIIYNNIANKLLKITLAVVRSGTPYRKHYRSVNPLYLKTA